MINTELQKAPIGEWLDRSLSEISRARALIGRRRFLSTAGVALVGSALVRPSSSEAAPNSQVVVQNNDVWNASAWSPIYAETAKYYETNRLSDGAAQKLEQLHQNVYGTRMGIVEQVTAMEREIKDAVDNLQRQGNYQRVNDVIASAGHCPWLGSAGIMDPRPSGARYNFHGIEMDWRTQVQFLTMKRSGRPVATWAERFDENAKLSPEGIGKTYALYDAFRRTNRSFLTAMTGSQVWERNVFRMHANDAIDGYKNSDTGTFESLGPEQVMHAWTPAHPGELIDVEASRIGSGWLYLSTLGKEELIDAAVYNRPL